jgi:hypothetical protein
LLEFMTGVRILFSLFRSESESESDNVTRLGSEENDTDGDICEREKSEDTGKTDGSDTSSTSMMHCDHVRGGEVTVGDCCDSLEFGGLVWRHSRPQTTGGKREEKGCRECIALWCVA